jgi:hypothetical protein
MNLKDLLIMCGQEEVIPLIDDANLCEEIIIELADEMYYTIKDQFLLAENIVLRIGDEIIPKEFKGMK